MEIREKILNKHADFLNIQYDTITMKHIEIFFSVHKKYIISIQKTL